MGHEVLTIAQMRAVDARAAALGAPTWTLMQAAGAAVAAEVLARWPGRPVLVLCGPGANGGDGYVAAHVLAQAGAAVRVAALAPPADDSDAARARALWAGPVEGAGAAWPGPEGVVIDAVFGAGLSRPLDGAAAAWAARTHARPHARPTVVAVDVPSGLPGDGEAPTGPCVQADLTVTFVRKKPAHLLEPGRGLCGTVVVADIGAPAAALAELEVALFENHPALWPGGLPRPARAGHKYQRGHLMALSGPPHQTGAVRLAALAGLRAGAGAVSVLSPPRSVLVNAAHLTAVMVRPFADVAGFTAALARAQALVIGPGAGLTAAVRALVLAALADGPPAVLDADALTVFAEDPAGLCAALRPGDVLTPHAGEFERLWPGLLAAGPTRIDAARAAAAQAGCTVLLKGPDTVIAGPDGRCVINATGTADLATAGSGDVLAGIIGGLMAQGVAGFWAAAAGAWLHGRCGEALGPGLIAEDLPGALPAVLAQALAQGC